MATNDPILGRDTCKFVEVNEEDIVNSLTPGGQWGNHKLTVDYFIKQYLERHSSYENGRFEL